MTPYDEDVVDAFRHPRRVIESGAILDRGVEQREIGDQPLTDGAAIGQVETLGGHRGSAASRILQRKPTFADQMTGKTQNVSKAAHMRPVANAHGGQSQQASCRRCLQAA